MLLSVRYSVIDSSDCQLGDVVEIVDLSPENRNTSSSLNKGYYLDLFLQSTSRRNRFRIITTFVLLVSGNME